MEDEQEPLQEKFSLYKFLQLEGGPSSTPEEIKKQYKKLVIKYHPDKNQGSQNAREQFQKLKEAYDILIDPQKKKLYDETGIIDGKNEQEFQSAYQFIRKMFRKVQKEDIEDFEKKYRFGEMEKEDLIDYYEKNQGNLIAILQSIPLSRNQDIERFIQFFETEISAERLKEYKNFKKTKNKIKLLPDETKQFEEEQQKMSDMKDLVLAIQNKGKSAFIEALQAKYSQPRKKKKVQKKVTKAKGKKISQ